MMIWLITGVWIALGCAQLAHVITLFTDRSLETYTFLSCVLVFAGIFIYACLLFVLQKRRAKACINRYDESVGKSAFGRENLPYIIVFGLLSVLSLLHFGKGYVPELSEGTFDIVLGNLQSGNIMVVHPFTGELSERVMPLRRQFVGLTSLYSGMANMFHMTAYEILCKIVPMILWILSMLLYWLFAQKLFLDNAKRWLFLCAVSLFYLVSSGGTGMVGNQLFYAGFTGEAIRSALLLPYTLYVTWQKKWFLAVIALAVEACIVWTTYGIGYCFLVVVCMLFVHLFIKRRAHDATRVE